MGIAIGASSILGVAVEAVSGTYVAPTKFIPYNTESLKYDINPVERRPIRNTPGLVDLVTGNATVGGDIEFDTSADIFLYMMLASRCTYTKTGAGPYVYVFTPSATAVPLQTLSISIKRGDRVFGYTGCVLTSFTLSVGEDGKMTTKATVFGLNEEEQAALVPTWPTAPIFVGGMYKLEIPTATQIYDTDTFEFSSEDSGTANPRMKDTPGAQFVSFGESNASLKLARDFTSDAEYEEYKLGTGKSITLTATATANNIIKVVSPVAKMRTYEVNIGSQGDLVRASVDYALAIDSTGKSYQITVTTDENIV